MERVLETWFDPVAGETSTRAKRKPVLTAYRVGKNKYIKETDLNDLEVLDKVNQELASTRLSAPISKFAFEDMWEAPRMRNRGISYVHNLFMPRQLILVTQIWQKAQSVSDYRVRQILKFWLDQSLWGFSILNRYHLRAYSHVNQYMSGVYYIPSQIAECSPRYNLHGKLNRLAKHFSHPVDANNFSQSTNSTISIQAQESSVDYIFTDPPFGDNFAYSELNFVAESWLKVYTNPLTEAIVDRSKANSKVQKSLIDYLELMRSSFKEAYRVLKPGRWMTVEFSNTNASVWNAIQTALQEAGFVVANVSALDKKQGSFKAVTTRTAVKQDLVISAYKTSVEFDRKFGLEAGKSEAVWEFIRNHLQKLPNFVFANNQAEAIPERQSYMLFDRMVAFHVQRSVTVSLSASEFYAGLNQRFPHRDGMYFLPEQIAEYDRKRMTVKEVLQLDLFVNDESTAVQWLRQQLTKKPQTFQELHPGFLKAIGGWAKHETTLELSDLLEQNFLRYDGGNIPKQIVSWLAKSSVHRVAIAKVLGQETGDRKQEAGEDEGQTAKLLDLVPGTGLETRDTGLLAAAKDRWYIPDPNKAGDLEKLREKALLKEFEEYRTTTKKLKVFRMEAMRAGFKHYFQKYEYKIIIQVARKVPDTILQEDPKLLMFYDNAVTRAGEE